LGAERFTLERTLSFFDTLVDCRAPINPYARKRHNIDRSMLIGAPVFKDARRAFMRFAHGAVLVEHSHDAFDTWLVGRGLESPLEHPIIDTTALARLVMELPKGQVPGLARLVADREGARDARADDRGRGPRAAAQAGRGPDRAKPRGYSKSVSCRSGCGCSSPDSPTPIRRTGRVSTCDFSSAERAARKIVSTSSVGLVRLTWRLTSLKSGSFSFT